MKRLVAVSLFAIAGSFGVARADAPQNQALCQDGTTALLGPGACSDHGGVVAEGAGVTRAKAGPGLFEATERKRAGAGTQPMAFCKDGMLTNAGEGACTNHGGIERTSAPSFQATLTEPSTFNPKAELNTPAATPRAAPAATPTARCHDGSLSYEGYVSDACTGRGGVAEWLTTHP